MSKLLTILLLFTSLYSFSVYANHGVSSDRQVVNSGVAASIDANGCYQVKMKMIHFLNYLKTKDYEQELVSVYFYLYNGLDRRVHDDEDRVINCSSVRSDPQILKLQKSIPEILDEIDSLNKPATPMKFED